MFHGRTCRFCHLTDYPGESPSKFKLIKYGVRHYAHPDCALEKLGAKFFDRLTDWQLQTFPALAAQGFLAELLARISKQPGSRA